MISFLSRTVDFFLTLPELMDLFVAGRDQSAANRQNKLAEGHPQCIVPIVTIVCRRLGHVSCFL